MWYRKELKARGKNAFKKNYWYCVLMCMILGIVQGGGSQINLSNSNTTELFEQIQQQSGLSAEFLITLVIGIISVALAFSILITIFVSNLFQVGSCRFYLTNSGTEKGKLNELVFAYKNGHFLNVLLTMLLRDVFILLWTMLFVVPGIVKAYSYRMVPYLLAENPDMKPKDAIHQSREMMNGQKWNTFVLDLSFIGWYLLTLITFGLVGIFYANPYIQATNAELYQALKNS